MTHHSTPFTTKRKGRRLNRALSALMAFGLTAALLPVAVGPAQAGGDHDKGKNNATLTTTSFTCGDDVVLKYTSKDFSSKTTYTIKLESNGLKYATGSNTTRQANFGKVGPGTYDSSIAGSKLEGFGKVTVKALNITVQYQIVSDSEGKSVIKFTSDYKGPITFNTTHDSSGTIVPVSITGGAGTQTYDNTGNNGQWHITGSYGCGEISGKFKLGKSTKPAPKPAEVTATGATITYGQSATLGYTFSNTDGVTYVLAGSPAKTGTDNSGTDNSGTDNSGTVPVAVAERDAGEYPFTVTALTDSKVTASAKLVVQKATTDTTPSATSFPLNQIPSSFTATVTGQYGTVPTGTLTFTGAGSGTATLRNGEAPLPTDLQVGTLQIDYSGDPNHYGSDATVLITAPVCEEGQEWNPNTKACEDVEVPPVTCEPGQELIDGECITPEPPLECQPGQELIDGECITPEPPLECEPGQELIDGECITPEPPLECEPGQELIDGECITPEQPVDFDYSAAAQDQSVQWGQATSLTAQVGENAEGKPVTFTVNSQTLTATAGAPDAETGLSTATVQLPAKFAHVGAHPIQVSWTPSQESDPVTASATLTVTPAPTALSASITFPTPGSAVVGFNVNTDVPGESLAGTINYSIVGPNGYASGPLSLNVAGNAVSQVRLSKGSVQFVAPAAVTGSTLATSTPTFDGLASGGYTVTAVFTPSSTNLLASDSAYTANFTVTAPTECEAGQELVDGNCVEAPEPPVTCEPNETLTESGCVDGGSGVDSGSITPEENEPAGSEPGNQAGADNDSDTEATAITATDSDDAKADGEKLAATGTDASLSALLAFALVAAGVVLVARRRTA